MKGIVNLVLLAGSAASLAFAITQLLVNEQAYLVGGNLYGGR